MSNYIKGTIFTVVLFGIILMPVIVFGVEVPIEIKSEINKKNQEIQVLNDQIKNTQTQLESTKNQKQTLRQELKQVNTQLSQLNLGIKSSKVAVEKLGLEIDATQYDIKDSQEKIQENQKAISETIRQIQQKDDSGNFLIIFLKNKSLANSVFEIQGLVDFQDKLSVDIDNLRVLKDNLNSNLNIVSSKKSQKEIEAENLKNKKIIIDETKKYRQTVLEETQNKEKLYQRSLTKLQKKQEQIAVEIEKLEVTARHGINTNTIPSSHSGILAIPVTGTLTQGYGATTFARSGGYRGKWHNGIDFSAPIGTPVISAEKGIVKSVGNQDLYCYKGAYGKFILINYDNNLTTLYAHLSLQVVKEGQEVNRGDIIGYIGNTGYSTGPHLHFSVYSSPTVRVAPSVSCGPKMPYGGDLNPMNYI
ncbi:hypothetical protein COV23_00955 [Candidatus Wolfebacteria bacterium CG10_big_fil_rev_8_21_14_0_10_31_9]|uniref:M23ase beta-sheet core domain-containing protein n=1 Tax=Candidatus Wolfebacteria bacterium CG10_big_fil_rev_8_21_14_0_10_31_9 TaxID=1975070 RepID=A0A2H0RDX8_9BACT|nr:MAG: hypothetical protein COV23_00955 [Candidatus Wolfebacteria bacterium CG10_big_fil_rev_8_21_14_0_10_31_9]